MGGDGSHGGPARVDEGWWRRLSTKSKGSASRGYSSGASESADFETSIKVVLQNTKPVDYDTLVVYTGGYNCSEGYLGLAEARCPLDGVVYETKRCNGTLELFNFSCTAERVPTCLVWLADEALGDGSEEWDTSRCGMATARERESEGVRERESERARER